MPKPPKAVHTVEAKGRGQYSVGKLRLYEILHTLNQGFEQVLAQLQQLEELGLERQPWKALREIVEENRAEVNFENGRAARGARREGLDLLWPASPRAGEEASRFARCADRGRPHAAAAEEAPGTATARKRGAAAVTPFAGN